MSMTTPRPQETYTSPNWRHAQSVSYIEEGRFGTVAFLDRWGYKAADNRDCNWDYEWDEDWNNAFDEGYLLHHPPYMGVTPPVTEEEYEDLTDPDYGKDPVYHGPYFVDQGDDGYFRYHGPRVYAPGPRADWEFKPTGCSDEHWYDRSLWFTELAP